MTEYVVCYARNLKALKKRGLWGNPTNAEQANPLFHRPNRPHDLHFPANTVETNWPDGEYPIGVQGDATDTLSATVLQPFRVEAGSITSDLLLSGRFKWQQRTLDEEIAKGVRFSLRQGKFRITFYREEGHKAPSSLIDDSCGVGTYEEASAEAQEMLGYLPFVYPKPVSLVKYLIRAATWNRTDSIVMDFFAGTGTTGHAVGELNREDGGTRRCVLVTDNSGKTPQGDFVAEAGEAGICRAIAQPRLLAAFTGVWASGSKTPLPCALNYYRMQAVG